MVDIPIENLLGELLIRHDLRLAVAESCTGGLVGHRVTNVPGASPYFAGGVIAYADEVKVRLLGVDLHALEQFGAVSREVVQQMAQGVRTLLHCELGLAITGIAGPQGGTADKPVGLTWIGLSTPETELSWRYVWPGDRQQNKVQSAEQALRLLVDYLQDREHRQ
jgi:PncC family amidohydrolase